MINALGSSSTNPAVKSPQTVTPVATMTPVVPAAKPITPVQSNPTDTSKPVPMVPQPTLQPTKAANPVLPPKVSPSPTGDSIPPKPILTKKKKGVSSLVLGALFLLVLIIGGLATYFLTQTNQDLRQQAAGDAYAGCGWQGSNPEGDITKPGAYACETYSKCIRCNNGDKQVRGEGGITWDLSMCPEPCKTNSCDGIPAFTPSAANGCRALTAPGCGGFYCGGDRGGGPCDPDLSGGGDACMYQGKSVSCDCLGLRRCECNNGVWVIGSLSQSCSSLCSCTDNVCPGCSPTPGSPTSPPASPTPTTVVGPQCISIALLDANGTPLTGDQDKNLKSGTGVKFKCGASGTVNKYEVQVILPNGTKQPVQVTGDISAVYAIPTASGKFFAQCRICTSATECQAYETITQ